MERRATDFAVSDLQIVGRLEGLEGVFQMITQGSSNGIQVLVGNYSQGYLGFDQAGNDSGVYKDKL